MSIFRRIGTFVGVLGAIIGIGGAQSASVAPRAAQGTLPDYKVGNAFSPMSQPKRRRVNRAKRGGRR